MRIAGVTGANQAGLAVIERGGRIGALRSGHDHHGTGGGGGGGGRRGHLVSARGAFELVRSDGESGVTARLLPFTVDGLIWAASMMVLDACRRGQPVPRLAAWSLGAGIVATVGANLAHGVGHRPVGALVSAWPALALVGSFERVADDADPHRAWHAGA